MGTPAAVHAAPQVPTRDSHRPQWATAQPGRRGLDTPFARRPQQTLEVERPPEVPDKERRSQAPWSFRRAAHETFDPYSYYADADQPIHKPRSKADWMRADQVQRASRFTSTTRDTLVV